jgi:hypothetical protein
VTRKLFVVVAVLGFTSLSLVGQTKPSIQGVWRVVERTTTGPNGATNKNPQPSLYIFTGKHYSIMLITSDKPRTPVTFGAPNTKLTDADMIALYRDWQPFVANSGVYELKGSTLTTRPIVAKTSAVMANKTGQAFEMKMDGTSLWLTQTIGPTGDKVANPTTVRLTRVE